MNMNEMQNTGRKINTDRIRQVTENTDAIENALSGTPDSVPKKGTLRVKGTIPKALSTNAENDTKILNPQEELDSETAELIRETVEEVGKGGQDPIAEASETRLNINFSEIGSNFIAKVKAVLADKNKETSEEIAESDKGSIEKDSVSTETPNINSSKTDKNTKVSKDIKNKLINIFKRKSQEDEPEEELETPTRVVAEEELEDDKKHRKGCAIIAGLTIGAVIMLIGGIKVIKWLNERVPSVTIDPTPVSTPAPDDEQVPDDALVNPEDLVTPTATPALTQVSVDEVVGSFYNHLEDLEAKSKENALNYQSKMDDSDNEFSAYEEISFILPEGKDTIYNMYYALHPELGISSNLTIDEVITLCNQIAANCHYHYFKSNLATLLQGCDEQIVERIDKLDELAASIKLENYNGDFKEGLYTKAEEDAAIAAGANITEGKVFFTNLESICENLSIDDVNNIPAYCILDAFYTGAASKIHTYINHFTDGANSSIEYLLKDREILNEENYQKFYAPYNTETIAKISEEEITSSTNNYYDLLSNYEKEYNITFENVTKENIDKLYNYFNGIEVMNPEEAYNLCLEIGSKCKKAGLNPQFEKLINNSDLSNMIKEYYSKISVLKVDYDSSDDKLLYSFLGEKITTGTAMINYADSKQNSLFVLIKAIFDTYKAETLYYVNAGKNNEFYVNGDLSFSCAMGIRDDIYSTYDTILEKYQRDESLKRNR